MGISTSTHCCNVMQCITANFEWACHKSPAVYWKILPSRIHFLECSACVCLQHASLCFTYASSALLLLARSGGALLPPPSEIQVQSIWPSTLNGRATLETWSRRPARSCVILSRERKWKKDRTFWCALSHAFVLSMLYMQDHDDSSVELAIRASRFVEALASACGIKWIARGLHRLVSAIVPPRLDAAFLSDKNYYEISMKFSLMCNVISYCLWSPDLFHLSISCGIFVVIHWGRTSLEPQQGKV